MPATSPDENEAFRCFLRQVWERDITPLLRGRYAQQRRRSARVGGKLAATAGLALDTLFRLRGKPFTRSMTVLGSTLGALLPDAWDWRWLREKADEQDRKVVNEQVRRRAESLEIEQALGLFQLPPTAGREELHQAWRELARRWHPDLAPDEPRRAEYHVRFVAYQAAYERLLRAYEAGLLPRSRT